VSPADVTDEQRLDFLKTTLFAKAELDRQNEIAQGNADEVAAKRAAAIRSAKEKAVAVALRRSATPFELDDLDDRELVHELATGSPGKRIASAATVAYADPSPDVWLAFFFTGVHLANKIDIDERDLAEARANEVKVRDIMYAAEADGFQPSVVAAAKAALEGAALARSQFLLGGHDTARQADVIRPSANRVVMIQAAGYNGCIAEPIPWLNLIGGSEVDARVDPCNEDHVSQRWTLTPDTTAGRYTLLNPRGQACLYPQPSKIAQDGAPITARLCSAGTSAATVWELLDSGQGNVEIRNVTNNKVITAVAGSLAGSLNIVQNPNGHTTAQQWRLIDPSHQAAVSKPPTGSFRIKGVQSGRCLRPAGALTTPKAGALESGAEIELRDCGSGTEQIWDVTTLSGTRFELRNRASQYCIIYSPTALPDVVNREAASQSTCGSNSTSWSVMFQKSAGAYLRDTVTGNYLSAQNNATANGTPVTPTEYAATTDEQWILEPASEGATPPAPIWRSSGKPLTSFSGTAVTFQPRCTNPKLAIYFSAATALAWWRADAVNAKKGLVRSDSTTPTAFQFCVVGAPTSSKMEVTLRNVAKNAYVREATDVTPSGLLIADQATAANAERFILQQREAASISGRVIDVLQSKVSKKYALLDTAATGTNAKAVRFMSATPKAPTELAIGGF
jgi:hypothetical protein